MADCGLFVPDCETRKGPQRLCRACAVPVPCKRNPSRSGLPSPVHPDPYREFPTAARSRKAIPYSEARAGTYPCDTGDAPARSVGPPPYVAGMSSSVHSFTYLRASALRNDGGAASLSLEACGGLTTYHVRLTGDGSCTCEWWAKHRGDRGPCKARAGGPDSPAP